MAYNVNIQGSNNSLDIFGSNVHLFGDNNSIGKFCGYIGIYNSSANTIYDYCSGVTLINSYNCYVNSGLTNVTIINGNGVTATTSNSGYGLLTGSTTPTQDVYITGATFSAGTLELQNSTGGTVTAVGYFPWEMIQTGQTVGATTLNLSNYNVGTGPGVYNVKAYVGGSNSSSDVIGLELYQLIKHNGTNFSLVGKLIGTTTSDFASAGASIGFNNSTGNIFVTVTGQTAQTINWKTNLKIY